MTYHMGKTGFVGMSYQASPSTPSSTLSMFVPVTEMPTLKNNIEKKWFQEYRNSDAEYNRFAVTRISAEGNISAPAYPSGGLEHMLFGVFGSMTSTQLSSTAAYLHTFTMSSGSPPIFTVAKGYNTLNLEKFGDVIIGSLDINYQPGAEIALTAGAVGQPAGIASTPPSASYGTERALTFTDVGASLGGSTNCDITNMSVKIDRGMKSLRTMCSTSGLKDNIQYFTTTKVEGSMEMFFQDYTEYKYWLGSSTATEPSADASVTTTGRALTITATGQSLATTPSYTNQFVLTLPQIVYDDADISTPWDDRMKIQFNFKASYKAAESAGYQVASATVRSLLTGITGVA